MTQALSKPLQSFDISAASFRGAARDLGEVLALLAGGVRPDPATVSRLSASLRQLQGFLVREAEQEDHREAIAQVIGLPVQDFRAFDFRAFDFTASPPFELHQPVREKA